MKKAFFVLSIVFSCLAALAQGKVTFGNDSNHLIVFSTDLGTGHVWVPEDPCRPGLAVPQVGSGCPNNLATFTAQLLAGTSAGSLAPVRTVSAGLPGLADGRLANIPVTLTGIPAGTPAFFQVRIYETAGGSYSHALSAGYFYGTSPVFTVVPGSIVGPPIVSALAPGYSTWANGPIVISAVPEPSTFALVGLALATALSRHLRRMTPEPLNPSPEPTPRHGHCRIRSPLTRRGSAWR